jgi:hypothetical protein
VTPIRTWLGAIASTVAISTTACAGSAPGGEQALAQGSGRSTQSVQSSRQLCESWLGRGRLSKARLDKVVPTTVGRVKAWVTEPDGDGETVEWATFSTSLSRAPLTDPVALCAYSMREGLYTPPSGTGDPMPPVEAIITIAQFDGDNTLYRLGSRQEMIITLDIDFG